MIITHNTYQLPIKLPRNEYGVSTNTSFIISSNDLFSNTASPSSSESSGEGSGSAYIPDFIGATSDADGVRGIVPAPLAGQEDYYLHGDGTWNEIPVMTPASELGFGGKKGLAPAPPVGSYDLYLTGGGNWTRPSVFTPATSIADGVQGEVPPPSMGQGSYYLLESTGDWVFSAAQKWLKEFPETQGLEPSGLTIDGDFNVQSPHTLSTFNLEVEGRAHFWELIIDRVKANGGQLLVSPSNFKVDEIGTTIIYYVDEEPIASILNYRPDIKRALQKVDAVGIKCQRVFMRNDDGEKSIVPSVAVGDMMRCRSFNIGPGEYEGVSNKDYWTFVLGVGSEQYRAVPEGYDESYGTANFIDLALYILTEDEALPIDTVINDDGSTDIPSDFNPQFEIADLKDISRQVMDGQHDRMEEFPDQEEMDQITVGVLELPDIPIPEELINVDDYVFHYEPVIHNDPVSGATTWDDPAYADELDKYNNDPDYADFKFGYGKIEIAEDDELACLGHLFDVDRRNAIIISSNTPIDPELVAPSFAQYNGIDIFGLSISKFRLSTIAKNGNYFYGWFGIDTGSGTYMSVTDAISTSAANVLADAYSYTRQSYDMLYSYVVDTYTKSIAYTKQTADSISSYVYDSYAYTLSFINQTADGISSYVADSYAYTLSFINQTADGISSYVIDSYAYTLSFINQTADSISSNVQDVYNGLYSYITQEAGKISSYVIDSYAYTLSFINQTADSITSSVQDGYNGLYSYITQEAGKISTYVVDSYAYTLSFTQQTANSISSTVQDLSSYTYSNINQLSDRIDLSVSKDELEVVGIHIDGQDSTVNIVGSLAVKQNGDGDVDTIKVYDEENILRVEVSPTDIPSKDDLDIESVSISLVNDYLWTNMKNASGRHVQYTSSWNIGATIHTGDIITLLNPAFSLSLAPRENSTWGATGWIDSWACYFRIETTDGRQIINESISGSGVPTQYLMNDSAKTVKFYKSGTYTSGQLSNNFDNKLLRVIYLIDIGFTSAVSNPINWTIDAYDTSGTLRYTKAGGVDPTSMMKIGQNGFYYTYSGNYHLYNGTDGFEVNNNGNKVSVTDEDVKICRTAYFTNESTLVIGEGDPETDSSIIVTTATNYISADTAQLIILYDTGLYGLGRELVIVGYRGLGIKTSKDPIWISSEMTNNGRVDKKLIYEANNSSNAGLLVLGDRDADYISALGIYMITSNGTIRLIALSDGWHVLQ